MAMETKQGYRILSSDGSFELLKIFATDYDAERFLKDHVKFWIEAGHGNRYLICYYSAFKDFDELGVLRARGETVSVVRTYVYLKA